MEEDIKILEEQIKRNNFIIESAGGNLQPIDLQLTKVNQAIENLINRNKELEERSRQNKNRISQLEEEIKLRIEDTSPKSKAKEKIEEQIEEADDVLINKNYLDNFNGTLNEQIHYYSGYKDATLFIQKLLEERN